MLILHLKFVAFVFVNIHGIKLNGITTFTLLPFFQKKPKLMIM